MNDRIKIGDVLRNKNESSVYVVVRIHNITPIAEVNRIGKEYVWLNEDYTLNNKLIWEKVDI